MDLSGVGPVLTLLGTFGGVWAVVLVFRWLQRDFVATYRKELEEVRGSLEAMTHERDAERRARWHAEDLAAVYRRALLSNSIPIPETDDPPPPPPETPPHAHE